MEAVGKKGKGKSTFSQLQITGPPLLNALFSKATLYTVGREVSLMCHLYISLTELMRRNGFNAASDGAAALLYRILMDSVMNIVKMLGPEKLF